MTALLCTVKPRYNAVSGRHLLRPRYKRGALYLYVLCHDVLLPLTMSIVYLFVSVLLLYQSVIKIDVPNKWASACVQPAIDDGR